jgi:uncharacterized delta-60 repeat protein
MKKYDAQESTMLKKSLCILLIFLCTQIALHATYYPPNTATHAISVYSTYSAITPNGATLYAPTFNPPYEVAIINTATNTFTGNVTNPNFYNPPFIIMAPNGLNAYVVNSSPLFEETPISIINVATNNCTGTINDSAYPVYNPSNMAITPDGTKAYIPTPGSPYIPAEEATICIADMTQNPPVTTGYVSDPHSFGGSINYVTIAPNGQIAYALATDLTQGYVINVATDTVIANISDPLFTLFHPSALAFSPDSTKAYICNGGSISVVNVATNTITGTVSGLPAAAPSQVTFTPDGSTAYACMSNQTVSIINVATNTVTGIVQNSYSGSSPSCITLTPNGQAGYISSTNILVMYYVPPLGVPDPLFGNQGFTITPYSRQDFSKALAIKSTGQIVLAGSVTLLGSQLFLAQYTTAGILDITFNSSGSTPGTQTLLVGSRTEGNALAIDSSGNILVAGFAVQSQTNMFLARYTSAGILDTSFNTTGYNTLSIGSGATANAIGLQTSGNIIVAGSAVINGIPNFAVARFTTSGALDTTFGTNGITTTQIGTLSSIASLAIDSSNNIVVVGNANNQITVARYTSSGALDNTFGTGGVAQPNIGSPAIAYSVIVDGTSDIVIAGSTKINGTNQSLIMRLTSSGAFDTTFNSTGYNITPIAYGSEFYTLVRNSSIYYLTAGYAIGAKSYQLSLAEYFRRTATGAAIGPSVGTLNTAFGRTGVGGVTGVSLTSLGNIDYLNSVALQPNDPREGYTPIVASGITNNTFLLGEFGNSIT